MLAANNLHVLILRPSHQAKHLLKSLRALGIHAYHLPTIDIIPNQVDLSLSSLKAAQGLIWTSANSVYHAPAWVFDGLQSNQQLVAIGQATADALRSRGCHTIVTPPKGAGSEILVEFLSEHYQLKGNSFLLFKGAGGREVISTELGRRGAKVQLVETYTRALPESPCLADFNAWMLSNHKVLWVTSCEAYTNLLRCVPSQKHAVIFQAQHVCASKRVENFVLEHGKIKAQSTLSAHDQDFINTLLENASILLD